MQDTGPTCASVAELAARSGTSVPCAGNLPVKLDDPDSVWFIDRGAVDLFLVEFRDGVEQAAPQHLLRRTSGRLLPGVAPDEQDDDKDTTLSLIAKGLPGTLLKRLPASSLSEVHPAELADQTDTWLTAMTDTLSRPVNRLPRPTALAEPGLTRTLAPCTLSVRRGVVWVSEPSRGASLFMDMVDQAELAEASGPREALIPLTRTSWLTLFDEATVSGKSTETLARKACCCRRSPRFTRLPSPWSASTADWPWSTMRISSALGRPAAARPKGRPVSGFSISMTCRSTGMPASRTRLWRTPCKSSVAIRGSISGFRHARVLPNLRSDLVDILDASGVRARRVRLKAEDNWWRSDSNAMLAFRAEDGRPVALLPGMFGRYREIDPVGKRSVRITADLAGALETEAWMFYRPLPSGNVNPADLLRIALHGSAADLARLVIAGIPGGLIKLLPALALGFVANHIVAGGSAGALYAVAVALAGFGLLGALLHLLQGTAMMRLEGRSTSRVEAAFWDRLMRLPPGILHRHPAGDLAMSGMTFQNLRDGLQGVVADSLLSIIFLLPVFGVIFFYDSTLGLIALIFSLASLLVTVALGLRQISPHGRMISAARRVAGRLFQIVGGIAKLRVENAEGSAFAIWARDYRSRSARSWSWARWRDTRGHSAPRSPSLPAGYCFSRWQRSATGTFRSATFSSSTSSSSLSSPPSPGSASPSGPLPPCCRRSTQMRPLLAAVPETEVGGEPVERLGGDVLFDHVSFRYDPDGPLILDDVTIRAAPGEFVAIAGESGAGKSTLFRLALGVDRPSAGAVYYDGRDLRHLNLKQVRRKIGAVPQSVRLHPHDLWDNIVAHHEEATTEEVWQAARAAGIEREVKAMPMGMMTMVGSSGSVLSGGESQRVTIARSLIGSPRIMLLDEATNWLDNESQAEVMQNLARLTSTRIVIAHRLSTLEQADRIYVMQAGKVVQSGSFKDLMEVDGVFRELVRRQIA